MHVFAPHVFPEFGGAVVESGNADFEVGGGAGAGLEGVTQAFQGCGEAGGDAHLEGGAAASGLGEEGVVIFECPWF